MHFVIFAIFGGFNLVLAQCPDGEGGLHRWSDDSLWGGEVRFQ